MEEGAIGFSTGLQYVPGSYADRAEIVELAKVAGRAGGIYASHMRNEGTRVAEAVAETIAVGEAARCPVQISHLKIDSPNRWGTSGALLDMIAAARRRGVDVRADQYAYTAGASSLSIRFPGWALEGGREKIAERLNDPATWERIKGEVKALLAERGFTDLSWAVIAMLPRRPVAERPVDQAGRRPPAGARRCGGAARDRRARCWRSRTRRWSTTSCPRTT